MNHKQQIDLPEFLRGIEPYAALEDAAFGRLVAAARLVHVERGETLFEQGDACRGVHVVAAGRIKLSFCSPHGAEKVVGIVSAGQGIGEASMSIGRSHQLHAEALSDTTLVFLPQHVLIECVESDRKFACRMMKRIAEKFHRLLVDVESSSLLSGAERIVDFLIREIDLGPARGQAAVIELSLSKSIIASQLNLTQEHFSRLLRQLSEHGMIVVDGRQISVPDVGRLRRYRDSGAGHCVNRGTRSAGRGRADWGRLAAA
ncbi:Crp/Fnr family transcriptional regulator [Dechloromonas sp. H13]|uniref:Crp/Fnr family transcriptional regulator n=1 Tax=Dechloromonas sp. H13 TaxID=2570193 RepID=UPI0012921100|nr:Crp/Fnr family transcriptional regulator [Dechloromonas sp. H13]